MANKRIALCMMTYHHSEMVRDVLEVIYDNLNTDVFDLYLCDSSEDSTVNDIYISYNSKHGNCFYLNFDSQMHSNIKVYSVFQNEMLQEQYSYLWMVPDYFFFKGDAINRVMSMLDKNPDFIFLSPHDPYCMEEGKIEDFNLLFKECAWFITQYGLTILRCDSVLRESDWKYLNDKYLVVEHRNFSHLACYFEYIYHHIQSISVFYCPVYPKNFYVSKFRSNSDYFNDFMKIWGEYWPKTIKALPDYYGNKEVAIKKHPTMAGTLSFYTLGNMRIRKVFGVKDFFKYFWDWNVISTASRFEIFLLSISGKKYAKFVAETGGIEQALRNKYKIHKLKLFCKKYKNIYIYGNGKVARQYEKLLDEMNIKIYKHIVTEKIGDEKEDIISIDEYVDAGGNGIVLAMGKNAKFEVNRMLKSRNIIENAFDMDIRFGSRAYS